MVNSAAARLASNCSGRLAPTIGAVTAVALLAYLLGAGSEEPARLNVDVGVEKREREFGGGDIDDQDAAFA